jgi:alpha-L-fucosidase
MFIHWGVYAVPAGKWQGKLVPSIGEWIMKNGQIPVSNYKAFAQKFTASQYDPIAWVKLAKAVGMKYIVITAKHHDGFSLYDSAASDWDVMNSGAKRDLIAPPWLKPFVQRVSSLAFITHILRIGTTRWR